MAFKILIICALIVATVQGNFFFPHTFPPFQMPPMPPMPTMPPMPNFVFPTFPSFEEIAKRSKTDPNTNYNAVSVSSVSNSFTDENGKTVKKGGTSVYSNNNGEVHEVQFGKEPPPLPVKKDSSTETPKETKTEASKDKSKASNIPKIKMIKKGSPKNFVSNFVSASTGGFGGVHSFSNSFGGGFHSLSSSSSSSSSNINGVKTGGGIASTLYNINGEMGGGTVFY